MLLDQQSLCTGHRFWDLLTSICSTHYYRSVVVKSVVTAVVNGATEVSLYCLETLSDVFIIFRHISKIPEIDSFVISVYLSIHLSAWNVSAPAGWL